MNKKSAFCIVVLVALVSTSNANDHLVMIRQHMDAYNRQDIDAMMMYVSCDFIDQNINTVSYYDRRQCIGLDASRETTQRD